LGVGTLRVALLRLPLTLAGRATLLELGAFHADGLLGGLDLGAVLGALLHAVDEDRHGDADGDGEHPGGYAEDLADASHAGGKDIRERAHGGRPSQAPESVPEEELSPVH